MGVFCDRLKSYVLQQPSIVRLAKTKADIAKKSSHTYLSHWVKGCVKIHIKFITEKHRILYSQGKNTQRNGTEALCSL